MDAECAAADRERRLACRARRAALFERLVAASAGDRIRATCPTGQRLALALAVQLAAAPRVLLLDEPTRGLDYAAKAGLRAVARELAGDGRGVVVATHDVEFVAHVADRVVVLAEGEVVTSAPIAEALAASPVFAPQVAKVLGSAAVADRRAGPRALDAAAAWLRARRPPTAVGAPRVDALRSAAHRAGAGVARPRPDDVLLAAVRAASRRRTRHSSDAPFIFMLVLPLLVAIVLASVQRGRHGLQGAGDARCAVGDQRRPAAARRWDGRDRDGLLPAGAGRPGLRAGLRLRARLYVVVRVGAADCRCRAVAAVPDVASAWIGLFAGLLPRRVTGRAEIVMLVVYGAVAAYVFGFLMNLSFWPFRGRGRRPTLSFVAGALAAGEPAPVRGLHLPTSTPGWDTGRAITNGMAIVVLGPAVLATLRRAARRASFGSVRPVRRGPA